MAKSQPPDKWTIAQFRRRQAQLEKDGFIPEEAFALANWRQWLDHWVIAKLRTTRKQLVKDWRSQGLDESEISSRLWNRYLDLGVRGQFEDEDWYFERVGAAA